jgi:hypothetical protein
MEAWQPGSGPPRCYAGKCATDHPELYIFYGHTFAGLSDRLARQIDCGNQQRETVMIKSLFATGTILVALAGPALASQCPALAAKAEEALKTASLDDATKAKVTELIATGKSQHDAGSHAESEATLGEALKLLGM